jgi:pimeloyl-ACP methyl ester carboxylesterase
MMRHAWLTALMCLALTGSALAQDAVSAQAISDTPVTETLIQIDLGRPSQFSNRATSVLRAVAIKPAQTTPKTALLFFVGWPGLLWLPEETAPDRFQRISQQTRFYALRHVRFFPAHNLSFVLVDCPTDQWGSEQRTPDPQGCSDTYRASPQHAEDVLQLIRHLRQTQGVEKIYLMGHSYGSVSSRWLAMRLGAEIQGSIHSASMTQAGGDRFTDYGSSVSSMDMRQVTTPWVYLHHAQDQCRNTVYAVNLGVAGSRMMTVRGGTPEGNPCGGWHYHSYQGRELEVLSAVEQWIRTGEITQQIGEP